MTREEFEQLVSDALDSLPEKFARRLDNVQVTVEVWPTYEQLRLGGVRRGQTLYGLYQGIPQTQRLNNYYGALPDKITVFAGPILTSRGYNPEAIKSQVTETVIHEIGHHFGMSDDQIYSAMGRH